ncbi:pilin [Marinobacter alexandrii]|uniref:pilin n=1 Tax=Marinobacter alexandrii TaxID=2570351 RepID=UPI003297423A
MNIKKAQQGFTLIELMIVIAIVGILAAIALPAYQDYTVRAKMSEVIATVAEAKTTIAEFAANKGSMPENASEAGINTASNGNFVTSADFTGAAGVGTYTVTASDATELQDAGGMTIELIGTINSTTRVVTWVCGPSTGSTDQSKYLPSSCRGA